MGIYFQTECRQDHWDMSSIFVLQVIPPKTTTWTFIQTKLAPQWLFFIYTVRYKQRQYESRFALDPFQLGTSWIITPRLLPCHHPSHIPRPMNCSSHMTFPGSIIFLLGGKPPTITAIVPGKSEQKEFLTVGKEEKGLFNRENTAHWMETPPGPKQNYPQHSLSCGEQSSQSKVLMVVISVGFCNYRTWSIYHVIIKLE